MTTRQERASGALWGQAVGDALGTTVEFQDQLGIATRAPSAWPRELIGEGPFQLLPGQVTDDTELALCLARSLAKLGRYDGEDVAGAYARWRRSGPFDCGQATDQAFGRSLDTGPGLAERMRQRASRKTQANGSLMRSSPLGIFGASLPREVLAQLARADSTLSHPDAVCQAACAVFVTTVAEAISTGLGGSELYARALAFAADSPVRDTLEAAAKELPVSDGESQGWVRLALQHAFFHLAHSTDFEAALVQTVSMGGDTDTNAAIVGALLGATLGVEAIPKRWRQAVRDCLPQRPPEYRCADLSELALKLLEGPGT
ncbi:MAG: ADP-ribosylglycohydrolase family protein [Archangium sp.]|nr:ADP-ribosylglycohydrolase family protein [Archangium sp.]